MANLILASPQLVEGSTITSGNELATLPASNLKTFQPTERWRTSGLSNLWAQFDLGAAFGIGIVALLSHNGVAGDTWRIRAKAASDVTVSPAYDTGNISMWPASGRPTDSGLNYLHSFHLPASVQTYRYWRIDMTSGAASYFEAGRAVIAPLWQPSINAEYGAEIGIDPYDVRKRTPWGGTLPEARGRPRYASFRLTLPTENEIMNQAYELDRLRGLAGDVFFCEDPAATTHLHRYTMQATMAERSSIVRPDWGMYQKTYRLDEVI